MFKNEIIKSIILVVLCFYIIVVNMYTIAYAKYSFKYTIEAGKVEIIV